ncbi:MAG: hypothetical protein AB7F40_00755 [Victivallaceae bacterium]
MLGVINEGAVENVVVDGGYVKVTTNGTISNIVFSGGRMWITGSCSEVTNVSGDPSAITMSGGILSGCDLSNTEISATCMYIVSTTVTGDVVRETKLGCRIVDATLHGGTVLATLSASLINVTTYDTALDVRSGACITELTMNGGTLDMTVTDFADTTLMSGCIVSNLVLMSNASAYMNSAELIGATVESSTLEIYGSACPGLLNDGHTWTTDLLIEDGGYLILERARARDTTCNCGAFMKVCGSATVFNTIIDSGANMVISAGCTASGLVIAGRVEGGQAILHYNTANVLVRITEVPSLQDISFDLTQGPSSGAMLYGEYTTPELEYFTVDTSVRYITGKYVLMNNAANVIGKRLIINAVDGITFKMTIVESGTDIALVATQSTGFTSKKDMTTYTLSIVDNEVVLSISGKFYECIGHAVNDDYLLIAENCTVSSVIYGVSSATKVSGNADATISLTGDSNTCNIYGGGLNSNVDGTITMEISSGNYTGIIYGGSYSYMHETTTGDIDCNVGSIIQTNNMKILKSGESAWVVGGGRAFVGTLNAGNVIITIDGAKLVHLVGGAESLSENTTATVASTSITISNSTISGDLFGGGYAYSYGKSVVSGDVSITIDTSDNNLTTVQGIIFAGGANPSHSSQGGSSIVEGDATITFTGSGDYLSVGTISGDGKVEGTVYGIKTLSFDDFTGTFLATVKNFDILSFSGDTVMQYVGDYTASTIVFDLTDRSSVEYFVDGFGFTDGDDNLLQIELGDSTGSYDLMTCENEDILEGVQVELYKDGTLYASFDYGDSAKGYTVEVVDGILALIG